jgi:hypothetical protein
MIITPMQHLLHIEENFQKKINKINMKSLRKLGTSFGIVGKP